jgi:hypothetical protein
MRFSTGAMFAMLDIRAETPEIEKLTIGNEALRDRLCFDRCDGDGYLIALEAAV